MRFKELYSMNEKFRGKFTTRDFGDGKINLVEVPDEFTGYSYIESYAHSKEAIWSFVFDEDNNLMGMMMGNYSDPSAQRKVTDTPEQQYQLMSIMHPSGGDASFSDYSGVEPIRPPFIGYSGKYHIPKEFNMTKFAPTNPTGIRSDAEWTLN
jgi:hypothetical protein